MVCSNKPNCAKLKLGKLNQYHLIMCYMYSEHNSVTKEYEIDLYAPWCHIYHIYSNRRSCPNRRPPPSSSSSWNTKICEINFCIKRDFISDFEPVIRHQLHVAHAQCAIIRMNTVCGDVWDIDKVRLFYIHHDNIWRTQISVHGILHSSFLASHWLSAVVTGAYFHVHSTFYALSVA